MTKEIESRPFQRESLVFYGWDNEPLRELILLRIENSPHLVDVELTSHSREGRCLICERQHDIEWQPPRLISNVKKTHVHFPDGKVELFAEPFGNALIDKISKSIGNSEFYLKTYRLIDVACFPGPHFLYHSSLFSEICRLVQKSTDAFHVLASPDFQAQRKLPLPCVYPKDIRFPPSPKRPWFQPIHVFVCQYSPDNREAEVDLLPLGFNVLCHMPSLPAELLAAKLQNQYKLNLSPGELLSVYRQENNVNVKLDGKEIAAGKLFVCREDFEKALGLEEILESDTFFRLRYLASELIKQGTSYDIDPKTPWLLKSERSNLGYDPWRKGYYVADDNGKCQREAFPNDPARNRNIAFRVFTMAKAIKALSPEIQTQLNGGIGNAT